MIQTRTAGLALALAAGLALVSHPAHAGVVTYTAEDAGAGPTSTFTNSDAEAAAFDSAASALAPETVINFESAPVGSFSSLTVAPGVTLTSNSGNLSIQNQPGYTGSYAPYFGYNTTPGGANYLQFYGGTATFTFAAPVQAFGADFTGVQLSGETIAFSDGTSQTVSIPNPGSGAEFVGFTDAGQQISSITINATNDIIGVDDVQFSPSAATPNVSPTPEPGSVAAFACGGLGLLGLALRRRARLA